MNIDFETLDLLGNDELIENYRSYWRGTQSDFALIYNINRGNFSSFLSRKKRGKSSREAVIQLILDFHNKSNCSEKKLDNMSLDGVIKVKMSKYVPRKVISINDLEKILKSSDNLKK